ncbi:transcriptional regulator PAI 2-type [Plectosphaerella plurivora]|uniref:Transcriptional regulator PAI 2-type n=1 Tax=Plectosphaerella plurivora TaxID=936078 RepID=A0A9P9ACM3_9PEZI|nr:transcriptional regulator PAI 2-type [Plectosphaerella plurivora]
MYIRATHAEGSIRVLRQLIRENPLGILTTGIASTKYPFLQSSHIPFVLDVVDNTSETELGTLRGHMARANPHSKAMMDALTAPDRPSTAEANFLEQEVLVLFSSPTHHYVTPKFYTETKPDTGKVVPTWNYAAAQAYGRARIYFDTKAPETSEYLSRQVDALTRQCEGSIMGYTGQDGRPGPWEVSDAPERYVDLLKKAIIGIEITIDRLEGKFKMSQESTKGDVQGVVRGFEAMESDVAQDMAKMVKERCAAQLSK